jgi:hypothetical protein
MIPMSGCIPLPRAFRRTLCVPTGSHAGGREVRVKVVNHDGGVHSRAAGRTVAGLATSSMRSPARANTCGDGLDGLTERLFSAQDPASRQLPEAIVRHLCTLLRADRTVAWAILDNPAMRNEWLGAHCPGRLACTFAHVFAPAFNGRTMLMI